MTRSADVTAALVTLQARWGAAAPVRGALALAPAPVEVERVGPQPGVGPPPEVGGIVSTGFPALDAILGPGGLPRTASVALRGAGWAGKTTLALRLVAEAQAVGAIVAWLDVGRSLDPVEAVARGVRLEWLVVVDPADLDEGLAIGGSLLAGRTVDLLVLDLPSRGAGRASHLADRLGRLAALARRADTGLVVLEPPGLGSVLAGAVAESTALRLELSRRGWIRLGRDVVGQRTEVIVARNHYGPPDRRAELRILYADGGERDACLRRTGLLHDPPEPADQTSPHQPPAPGIANDETPSALLAAPPPRPRPRPPLRLVPERAGRPRRTALGGRDRPGRRSGSPGSRRPAGDGTRQRSPAGAGGDVPRP